MTYSTKNYNTDNGDTLVIGGKLKVEAGAVVEGLSGGSYTLPAAGAALGGVKKGIAVPNAVADGELATLNALLASLRTAGVIA